MFPSDGIRTKLSILNGDKNGFNNQRLKLNNGNGDSDGNNGLYSNRNKRTSSILDRSNDLLTCTTELTEILNSISLKENNDLTEVQLSVLKDLLGVTFDLFSLEIQKNNEKKSLIDSSSLSLFRKCQDLVTSISGLIMNVAERKANDIDNNNLQKKKIIEENEELYDQDGSEFSDENELQVNNNNNRLSYGNDDDSLLLVDDFGRLGLNQSRNDNRNFSRTRSRCSTVIRHGSSNGDLIGNQFLSNFDQLEFNNNEHSNLKNFSSISNRNIKMFEASNSQDPSNGIYADIYNNNNNNNNNNNQFDGFSDLNSGIISSATSTTNDEARSVPRSFSFQHGNENGKPVVETLKF
ncbi:hypothetical protein PACTADRAFT_185489 [Pachysolen tannophilus NRRL Y-2460]|uniref:Uncharacterized protein n=1 Tax=Pachysolen tannophilus NRRL Y-2460 TaxID=669874 RepID=A0A1E4U289_PACTA|nr:hypothetical protein PACTADRAFT_185489 [Pachysolen tannophilus NRRL Y-2460]